MSSAVTEEHESKHTEVTANGESDKIDSELDSSMIGPTDGSDTLKQGISNEKDDNDEAEDNDKGDDSDSSHYAETEIEHLVGLAHEDLDSSRRKAEKKSRKFLEFHVAHSVSVETRLSRLEHRLDVVQKRGPSPPAAPVQVPQKIRAIPELNVVQWTKFKKIRNRCHPCFTIDILSGEPVIWSERKALPAAPSSAVQENEREYEINMNEMEILPERIRINSIPVLRIIAKLTGDNTNINSNRPLVILRPFKALLHFESELRNTLDQLETAARAVGGQSEHLGDRSPTDRHEDSSSSHSHDSEVKEARDDLRCVINFLDICKDRFLPQPPDAHFDGRPEIKYHELWYLFKPGTIVVAKQHSQKLWRVFGTTSGRPFLSNPDDLRTDADYDCRTLTFGRFTLDCYYLEFDGTNWAPLCRRFTIPPFDGQKQISLLAFYPLTYEKDAHFIDDVRQRAALFLSVSRVGQMYYKGQTLTAMPDGSPIEGRHSEIIDSSVMVDNGRAFHFNPHWRPQTGFTNTYVPPSAETVEATMNEAIRCSAEKSCNRSSCCENECIMSDNTIDQQHTRDFFQDRSNKMFNEGRGWIGLLPEESMLLPDRVFGFILRSRKWACLHINNLSEVKEDRSGFDGLEIEPGHKQLIHSLVETHYRTRELSGKGVERLEFDLVKAKGKGLIILLHGAPGVGKTSTAECMAAMHGRPLFPITCGDLGTTADSVERNLEMNFQLAESWGCVLLLDEADVFLAERTKTDVERNALVSVFLRALEYYRGLLFLTTNRVGTIDEAFKSRVHVALLYNTLDWERTQKIWTNHLDRIQFKSGIIVERESILAYAKHLFQKQMHVHEASWNGRQIRNAFQTAMAIAEYDKISLTKSVESPARPVLSRKSFEIVAQASMGFEDYLKSTRLMSATKRAQYTQVRNDMYGEESPQEQSMRSSMAQPGIYRPYTPQPFHTTSTMITPRTYMNTTPVTPQHVQPLSGGVMMQAQPQMQHNPVIHDPGQLPMHTSTAFHAQGVFHEGQGSLYSTAGAKTQPGYPVSGGNITTSQQPDQWSEMGVQMQNNMTHQAQM